MQSESIQPQNAWKEYSGKVAWPTVLLALLCFTGFLSTVVAAEMALIPIWAGLLINAVFCYIVFTPLHESSHSNVGTRKGSFQWLDTVIGWASGAMLIAPYSAFKVLHLRHHSNTNDTGKDPDHWMATSNPVGLLFRGLTIIPRYYFHFFSFRDKQSRDKTLSTILGVLGLAAIYVAWGHSTSYLHPLLLWVAPALLALAALAIVFDWLPHYPHQSKDRYQNTRVMPGGLLNAALLGQNYHLIHHLYPAVPFYHYRHVFDDTREYLEAKGAPIGWSASMDAISEAG